MNFKIKEILSFYKNSIKDLYGFGKYMTAKFIKFHLLFVFSLVIVCLLKGLLEKETFNIFTGVLISILAAILFEGHRSYIKHKEDRNVILFCLEDVKDALNRVVFRIDCSINTLDIKILVNKEYGKILYSSPGKLVNFNERDALKTIKVLIRDTVLFNNLKFEPKFYLIDNQEIYDKNLCLEYEAGLKYYSKLLELYADEVLPVIERSCSTLTVYCEDRAYLERLLSFRNNVRNFVEGSEILNLYRKGTFVASYGEIIFLLKETYDVLELTQKSIREYC